MSYFSRLTDIVTCNLTQMLDAATDPRAALSEIIAEMQEGLVGAQRSVNTATNSELRLQREIDDHKTSISHWTDRARQYLAAGSESEARQCLTRKREIEDLIAGLEQQHRAAIATRQNLATMQRALEARLSEALRKRDDLGLEAPVPVRPGSMAVSAARDDRDEEIDAELEALKRELGT